MVKSVEPLSTACLAIPVLKQRFNLRLLLAILVACSGIMITASAAHGGVQQLSASKAYLSMGLGMMANVGFSSRACVAKRFLSKDQKVLEAYGKLSLKATQSGSVLLLLWLLMGRCLAYDSDILDILEQLQRLPTAWLTTSLTYFLYQAASMLLLNYFLVETHALLVALKCLEERLESSVWP